MSLAAAAALGVGGMMGAGLYTLLGLAASSAGSWLPLAFVVAGAAATFSVYSYARLGARYPSSGGAAQFVRVAFGDGLVSGSTNVFQYVAYLIATSMYAAGFAEYGTALLGDGIPGWTAKATGVGVVVLFTAVNIVGGSLVGRAETAIIAVEALILVVFVAVGAWHADPSRLTEAPPTSSLGLLTAAGLLYVTYQGFGVVANASGEMRTPRVELPRAMFVALGVVATIYLVVSSIVVMVLPMTDILTDSGHVLADAGQAIAGRSGFVVIAAAALLATASAVNATIFAASSVGTDVARSHQLPAVLGRSIGERVPVALLVSAAIVVALVLFFPLSAVGQMTSLAFLAVYAAVSAGHLRIRAETGARAWPLITAVVVNIALFVALLVDTIRGGRPATWIVLLAALGGSVIYTAARGRLTGHAPKRRSRSA